LHAYGVISGRVPDGHVGGAEVQQKNVARELVRRGYEVSFVTLDHGQPEGEVCNGIRIHKAYDPRAGRRVLRFFHPRWTGLRRALARADADVYYQRGAGQETGQVAQWCRRHRRSFIYASASDLNCDPRLPDLTNPADRVLFRYGLRRATRVISQTHDQVKNFARHFGVDTVLIRSCCEDPCPPDFVPPAEAPTPFRVLWIGRINRFKRPEWVLDLAQACPELMFDMVGASREEEQAYVASLAGRQKDLANLAGHGRVPHERIGEYYARAGILLCTSVIEGFPNTFLEAWARGIPAVSTVDPDGIIGRFDLGCVGGSVAELAAAIRELAGDAARWRTCARNARRYFVENHTVKVAGDAYCRLLEELRSQT